MSRRAPTRPPARRRCLHWLGAGALALRGSGGPGARAGEARTVHIVARKFQFEPAEITLRLGEPVRLHFSAPEVAMGFNLPDFRLRTDILPGPGVTLDFTPDRVGDFPFSCDLFCGSGHEDMAGVLHVTAA